MPTSSPKSSKSTPWHTEIAKNRNKPTSKWHEHMLAGRREAVLNPSNIRLIRLRLNIHQEEMANKISSILAAFVKSKLKSNPEAKVRKINSVSESTFGSIERGKRLVSAEMSKIISNILRVPPTKLFKFVRHNKYVAIINKSNV